MQNRPFAFTGANTGIGLQIAKELAAHPFTVLVGARTLADPGTVEQGVPEAVRLALIGRDGQTDKFSDEDGVVAW